MLVSFLVFGQIFTFLVAEYLVYILHILQVLSIHKIESLNFSLVLKRTL